MDINKPSKYSCELYKSRPTKDIRDITTNYSSPSVFSYVWWVLYDAINNKISTLYFLARDGYIMHKIALQMCEKFHLPIQCKYLYCSRLSLRMPSYHLIGEEAFSIIFNGGYQISPYIVLNRIGLTYQQRNIIYKEVDIVNFDEKKHLSKSDYNCFINKIKQSKTFYSILMENSKKAYQTTIGYLEQEGLLNVETIALVDTGWTGSMQRTLRQLIESTGSIPKIKGYYFGLYQHSRDPKDGEYSSWYFSPKTSPFIKSKFNNNLFECICSAPHGMTIEYTYKNGEYIPVLKDTQNINYNNWELQVQLDTIEKYTELALESMNFTYFNNKKILKSIRKLMKHLMYKPNKDQVNAYLNCRFCDDVSEIYFNPIAQKIDKSQLQNYLFTNRLYNKFFNRNVEKKSIDNLFWPYGSIAISDIKYKAFYRFNIFIWDIIRYLKSK